MRISKLILSAFLFMACVNTAFAAAWCGYNPRYILENNPFEKDDHNKNYTQKLNSLNTASQACSQIDSPNLNSQINYWQKACADTVSDATRTEATRIACNEGSACQAVGINANPTCFTTTQSKTSPYTFSCTPQYPKDPPIYYFDQTTKKCQPCKRGYILDPASNECVDKCTPPTVFNSRKNKCEACVAPTAYNTQTKTCTACTAPTLYNPATKACEACPSSTIYNDSLKKCEPCPSGTVFSAATKTCQACAAPTAYNETTKTCAPCSAPTIYNPATKACEACPSPTVYNNTSNKCEACPAPTEFSATSRTCEACADELVYQNGACRACSGNTPLFNKEGKNCVAQAFVDCATKYNQEGSPAKTLNYLKDEVLRLNQSLFITKMTGGYSYTAIQTELNAKAPCCKVLNNGVNCPAKK